MQPFPLHAIVRYTTGHLASIPTHHCVPVVNNVKPSMGFLEPLATMTCHVRLLVKQCFHVWILE